jgi:hypothetical protein
MRKEQLIRDRARGERLRLSRDLGSLLIAVSIFSVAEAARADEPGMQECIAANEKSGPLQHQGKLREARAQLRLCATPSCPTLIRDDCVSGATRLDAAVPSVVFAAQDASGNDLTAVVVTMDGQVLADALDGKAVEVDPGEHAFRLETPGQPPVEKRLVILEGEKDRRERVVMGSSPSPKEANVRAVPVAPPMLAKRPFPVAGWVAAGVGVAAFGFFGTFGGLGVSERSSYGCATGCPGGEKSAVDSKFVVADVALGVGVVAVGAVVWIYLARPTVLLQAPPSAFVDFHPVPGGGVGVFTERF